MSVWLRAASYSRILSLESSFAFASCSCLACSFARFAAISSMYFRFLLIGFEISFVAGSADGALWITWTIWLLGSLSFGTISLRARLSGLSVNTILLFDVLLYGVARYAEWLSGLCIFLFPEAGVASTSPLAMPGVVLIGVIAGSIWIVVSYYNFCILKSSQL